MFEDFVTTTLARIATATPSVGDRTLFSGGAGVAYFLVEAARLLDRPDLRPLARTWLAAPSEDAGLINGGLGTRFVEVLIAIAEQSSSDAAIEAFIAAASLPAIELARGSAGVARGAGVLASRVNDEGSRRTLEGVRDRMVDRVLAAHAQPIAPQPNDPLGMAHGIAGELWTLVAALGPDHPVVAARLEELAELRVQDLDGLVFWPPTLASDPERVDYISSWCNGIAGHTMLWCEVARRAPAWSELAEASARTTHVLDAELPTLCCGLAGQALALHKYAALSGDAELASVADERLEQAIARIGNADLWMWQGLSGVAMVALLRSRGLLTWPCFE